jgi:tRNA threonylcarbamoyladenosine biosynthesis protein TsaB
MIVLAFDTCFDACSVCVAQSREAGIAELASALERFETGHAERLIPMIEEAMRNAGLAFEAIDRVAVTTGPGTFTARGIALSTGVATVGVSSLAVMAEVTRRELGDLPKDTDLAVAVDARRGQAYAQLFGASGLEAKSPPQLLTIEATSRLGDRPLVVVGSAAEMVVAAADSARSVSAQLPRLLPDAAALARMAFALPASQAPLVPLYLRPPDAKPQEGKAIARAQQ